MSIELMFHALVPFSLSQALGKDDVDEQLARAAESLATALCGSAHPEAAAACASLLCAHARSGDPVPIAASSNVRWHRKAGDDVA